MVSIHGAMTDERKKRIWFLWKQGHPMAFIAKDIMKPPATVYSFLEYHGGIEPDIRCRKATDLTLQEREYISRSLAIGISLRAISRYLNRAPSTISREVSRNGGIHKYRAYLAEQLAFKNAKRPKPFVLQTNIALKQIVIDKLKCLWSPEQISGWLKTIQYPDNSLMHISHETIYKSLYLLKKNILPPQLKRNLRRKRMFRHARNHHNSGKQNIPNLTSIWCRPEDIKSRQNIGHWEGDMIVGTSASAIVTLVERKSRYTLLGKTADKKSLSVIQSVSEQLYLLPPAIRQTLTWDRGCEMAKHHIVTAQLNMSVYFCDASSPWQKGTNENTNGLLRQYLPKGKNLNLYSQEQLNKIALQLNTRPRKILGFRTPLEVFEGDVALTG